MSDIEFTDRYDALEIPYPNPDTMCTEDCEGTGWVPLHKNDDDPKYAGMWNAAEKIKPSDDDWHFVKCPCCGGSGLKNE